MSEKNDDLKPWQIAIIFPIAVAIPIGLFLMKAYVFFTVGSFLYWLFN